MLVAHIYRNHFAALTDFQGARMTNILVEGGADRLGGPVENSASSHLLNYGKDEKEEQEE